MEQKHPLFGAWLWAWTAADYHPHQRGRVWEYAITAVLGGIALWNFIVQEWISGIVFLFVLGLYWYQHKKGTEPRTVTLYERGMMIAETTISYGRIEGYYCVVDTLSSILYLRVRSVKNPHKVESLPLQMGEHGTDWFRAKLAQVEVPELFDQAESPLEMWIRILKL